MSEAPHNLYESSRDDIEQMYGRRNDRSDYGVRGPLRSTVEVVTEEPDDMARIVEYYGPEADAAVDLPEDPYVPEEQAVPMPQWIRDMMEQKRRDREANK